MEETKFDRSDGRGATRSLGDLEAPRQGQARPVNPSVLREWSDVQHGSLSDAVARLVHPRLQLAAPENPRLQWLRTLVPIFQALGESAARRFVIVFPTARAPELAILMDVEGPVRVCPRDVPHAATGPGGASPLAAVRYATQSAEDDAATGERISAAFGGPGGKSPGHISVVVAHSRSELEYARRVLREAAARRAGFAPDSGAAATASYVVAPPREEEAGEIMTGLHVQLRDMSNPAYDGLNGVVVGPLDDGAWAVMPSDTRRALSLRALARAAKSGENPSKVAKHQNSDPLKPLAVFARNIRPIVDADRAPIPQYPDLSMDALTRSMSGL